MSKVNFFTVDPSAASGLQALFRLDKPNMRSKLAEAMILAMEEGAGAAEHREIEYDVFKIQALIDHYQQQTGKTNITRNTLYVHLTRLRSLGCIDTHEFPGKPFRLHKLSTIRPLLDSTVVTRNTQANIEQVRSRALADPSANYVDFGGRAGSYYLNALMQGWSDCAMRLSDKDKRKEIKVDYVFNTKAHGRETVGITATTSTRQDAELMLIKDCALFSVLISHGIDWIQRARDSYLTPQNRVIFDIDTLIEQLGRKKNCNRTRRSLQAQLQRIADTSFEYDVRRSQTFQRLFAEALEIEVASPMVNLARRSFRPIKEYTVYDKQEDLENNSPAGEPQRVNGMERFWVLEFNDHLWEEMLNQRQNTYLIDYELTRELNSLAHRMVSLPRARLTTTNNARGNHTMRQQLDELAEMALPGYEVGQFSKAYKDLYIRELEKKGMELDTDGVNVITLHGYQHRWDGTPETIDEYESRKRAEYPTKRRHWPVIEITRDRTHKTTGDDNARNRHLRETAVKALTNVVAPELETVVRTVADLSPEAKQTLKDFSITDADVEKVLFFHDGGPFTEQSLLRILIARSGEPNTQRGIPSDWQPKASTREKLQADYALMMQAHPGENPQLDDDSIDAYLELFRNDPKYKSQIVIDKNAAFLEFVAPSKKNAHNFTPSRRLQRFLDLHCESPEQIEEMLWTYKEWCSINGLLASCSGFCGFHKLTVPGYSRQEVAQPEPRQGALI